MSELPLCKSAADMGRLDGQRVRVIGVYRRELVARKQGEAPTHFLGTVQLELEGKATDYDAKKWKDLGALISLGADPRPADEVTRFADQKVAVEGKLLLRPAPTDPDVAQEDPQPTLVDLGTITAAP